MDVPNISFSLDPVGNRMVSGRVFGVGIPGGIVDIPVIAYQWQDFWEDPNLKNALTGPDGSFDLQLPAGNYFFYGDCDDCYHGSGRIVIHYDNQLDLLQFPEAENIDFFLEPFTTDIRGIQKSPWQFEVYGNYPNPFNAQTKIPIFSTYESVKVVKTTVYDMLGRIVGETRVATIPGMNYMEWGLDDFHGFAGSGVYFYRVGDLPKAHRMILLK